MSGAADTAADQPVLTVGSRVIAEMVRLAALEVPGVLTVGRPRSRLLGRGGTRPIVVHLHGSVVDIRVSVIARPGQALGQLADDVRTIVGATIRRLLGLEPGTVTVVIDGVGG